LQQWVNGHQTIDVTDETDGQASNSGIVALQLHVGQPFTVQFKNLRLKKL